MAVSFKGAHFPQEIILTGVRWYVAYPLSTRHVGPNLAKTRILAKYNTVNQVDRLHGSAKPAHAARE
jgi:putative transposase